jgi:hypothetical protein
MRRKNHLVSGTKIQTGHRNVQSSGAITNGNAMKAPDFSGDFCFKLPDERAIGGNPTSINALTEIFLFVPAQQWLVDRNKRHRTHQIIFI